jgi:hypothetical protein
LLKKNENNKETQTPNYHMRSVGGARSCTTYVNEMAGLVGHSDQELLGAYALREDAGYISSDSRAAIGKLLRELRAEGVLQQQKVPIPGQEGCLHVYNVTFRNGEKGAIIINPAGSKLQLDPWHMTEMAWQAGVLEVPGLGQPELPKKALADCPDEQKSLQEVGGLLAWVQREWQRVKGLEPEGSWRDF